MLHALVMGTSKDAAVSRLRGRHQQVVELAGGNGTKLGLRGLCGNSEVELVGAQGLGDDGDGGTRVALMGRGVLGVEGGGQQGVPGGVGLKASLGGPVCA